MDRISAKTSRKKSVVQKIIKLSGNSFHSRIVNLLRRSGWNVLVSPYYSDNFTDKPREIDIIAEKKFDVNSFGSNWLGTVDIRLFIECKYVVGETVFWFDAKDKERAINRIMIDTGLENPYKNNNITKLHYFLDEPVAKLFASEKSRGEDHEVLNKAINQNLNALLYYRSKDNFMPLENDNQIKSLLSVPYPIIVFNSFDKFYRTNIADEKQTTQPIAEPFQLEINYAYTDEARNGFNEYFLIDVVSNDTLKAFLADLEQRDVGTLVRKLGLDRKIQGIN